MPWDEIVRQIFLFIFTFTANLFASVSGGGAGFIQFPLLILLGLPFATALGTHKVAVVFLGIGALSKKKLRNSISIDKTVAIIMLTAGCLSVVAGSVIVISAPSDQAQMVLGVITIGTGIYTMKKKGFGTVTIEHRSLARNIFGTICIMAVGLFSGSLSSGAGLFATMTLAGIITAVKMKNTKNGSMMAYVTLEDDTGSLEVICFSRCLTQYGAYIQEGQIVAVTGQLSLRDDKDPNLLADAVRNLAQAEPVPVTHNCLWLQIPSRDAPVVDAVQTLLFLFPGTVPVKLYFADTKQRAGSTCDPQEDLLQALRDRLGEKNVVLQ